MRRKSICIMVVMILGVISLAARPLGTEDYGTAEKGKSALELGYDNSQTLVFALKHVPLKDVELSAEYELPTGTSFARDQVVLNAEFNLAQKSLLGLDYGVKLKYNNSLQTLGLIWISALEETAYNIHSNIVYEPEAALTFSLAGELKTLSPLEPVAEVTLTGSDSSALVGFRYEILPDSFVDAATTFTLSGADNNSSYVGFSTEF